MVSISFNDLLLSIFWAKHVLTPIIVISLFCVFSKPFITTWLDISLFQILVYMAFVKCPLEPWNETWPRGIFDHVEEYTFVSKNIFPARKYLSHNLLGDMDGKYLKCFSLFMLTCSRSCSLTHKIASLEIPLQIPSSF